MFLIYRLAFFLLSFGLAFALGIALSYLLQSKPSTVSDGYSELDIADRKTEPIQTSSAEVSESLPDLDSLDINSPHQIQTFIENYPTFHAQSLWDRLGIAGVDVFPECSYCSAQLDETNVGEFRDTVLLKIENRATEECRFILFRRDAGASFHVIGFIDHQFGRYQMPTHRWIENGGRTFLVVRGQTISGSGVAGYLDRLFALRRGRLIEIAGYPGQGHYMITCADPNFEFAGKVNEIVGSRNDLEVVVTLEVRKMHCTDSGARDAGVRKRRMVFRWSTRTGESVFDRKSSSVTEDELAVLAGLGLVATDTQ